MTETKVPRTAELPKPETMPFPYRSAYETEVLVVGCGFAGLNAAWAAKQAGRSVLVIDKGRPGYSGLSPWPSSFRWFDPDRGDVADAYRKAMQTGGDYIANMNWYEKWIQESKGVYERLTEWGILAQYPKASNAGDFYEREDFVGYRETFDRFDRHKKWISVLNRYEIPFLEHTMVTELITDDQGIQGAIAFHVPSGRTITVSAKAVVLATGGGAYKPTGYPVGGDTFDGEYMAFQLGLPIAGKEFEDFHKTPASAPGNVFLDNHWQYLENIWLCGGDVTEDNCESYGGTKGNIMVLSKARDAMAGMAVSDGSGIQDVRNASYTRRGGAQNYEMDENELRSGKMSTPVVESALGGAATGMCCHLTSGVFCGVWDSEGKTEIPGLYTAGDGIHATSPSGAAYPCGVGFTSCFTSIDGAHAGTAAAEFAANTKLRPVSQEAAAKKIEDMQEPLRVEKGYDPNWARDILQSLMAPFWVLVVKSEPMLRSALNYVEYMRDHIVPKLSAATSHDLRLCIEMKHKVLSAELKLRASLARCESRGTHYREDYPYRDDSSFLCYLTQRKTAEGIIMEKIPVPEEWTGDRSLPYEKRYRYFFPGEPKAKGFTLPERSGRKEEQHERRAN